MQRLYCTKAKFVLALMLGLAASASVRADEAVYQSAIHSTVMIFTPQGHLGSGAVVDVERRLVVTANHVPGDNSEVRVLFPQTDSSGRVIHDWDYYQAAMERLAIPGKVVLRNPKADLALIELDRLPEGVKALPLGVADTAQDVHIIGHGSSKFGGVFGCRSGMVANRYKLKANANLTPLKECWVLETQIPTNHGDSGSPIVNKRGELVGIVSQGTNGVNSTIKEDPYHRVQVTDHSVDALEVQSLMEGLKNPAKDDKVPR
jgi:S1-C subfamily serine protease